MHYFNPKHTLARRRSLRKNQTYPESLMWQKLRNKRFYNYKFYRQYGIGNYIVDFYCHKLKLVIEIDGDSHFTDRAKSYDEKRTKFINKFNIEVIRFTNDEVIKNIDLVLNSIKRYIDINR